MRLWVSVPCSLRWTVLLGASGKGERAGRGLGQPLCGSGGRARDATAGHPDPSSFLGRATDWTVLPSHMMKP